jgi:ABC-type antimicrobial peptide transport system permease subunit
VRIAFVEHGTLPLYMADAWVTPNFLANAESPSLAPFAWLLAVLPTDAYLKGLIVVHTAVGLLGGLWLARNLNAIAQWLERTFEISVFPPSVYYLDRIPTQINAPDVMLVVLAAFLLTLLAGIYPAVRAAGVSPVEVLRYE